MDFRIEYSKEIEKFKDYQIMLMFDETPMDYSRVEDDDVEIINVMIFDADNRSIRARSGIYCLDHIGEKEYTVRKMAQRFMEYIVNNKNMNKFFYVAYCDTKYNSFTFWYLHTWFSESPVDRVEIEITNKFGFTLNNVVGFYYDKGVLRVIGKAEVLERRKTYCVAYSKYNPAMSFLDRKISDDMIVDVKNTIMPTHSIQYSETDEYWLIQFGEFNCILSKQEEQHPFIEYISSYVHNKKSCRMELVTWLKDDIITKIPDADLSINSDKCRKVIYSNEDAELLLSEIKKLFEELTARDRFQMVETDRYKAYYSRKKAFNFKIVNKETEKIACLFYYHWFPEPF